MSEQPKNLPWGSYNHVIMGNDGFPLVVLRDPLGTSRVPTDEEKAEYAAFIVKAVNSHQMLVEALQSCVKILPRYTGCGEFPSQDEECEAVLEDAREALAAARGESQ